MGWQYGNPGRGVPRLITGNERGEERGDGGRYLDQPRDEQENDREEEDVERRPLVDGRGD